MRYKIELAGPADDTALRRRMAEDVMEGSIAVTFRREPNYFAGTAIQGRAAEVLKCVDSDNHRIVGLATRAALRAYINGAEENLGYLCDLRADRSIRGGLLLARGYRVLKALHDAAPVKLYYTVILGGNDIALKVLTSGRATLPSYKPIGKILTPAIHLDRKRRYQFSPELRIVRGNSDNIDEIVEFVKKQYRQKQFAPVYETSDIGGPRLAGLRPEDIYVATKGNNIVGCVACWDQSHVRQIFIEGLTRSLRLVRPFHDLAARVSSRKPLPKPGTQLPFFYLAWVAIEHDNQSVFRELIEYLYEDRRDGPWHFFIAGLHESSPLVDVFRAFRRVKSSGQLFVVHWQDGADEFSQLDRRIPHIEVGAL